MVNRIWPTVMAGGADSVSFVSASACHIGGTNSVHYGQNSVSLWYQVLQNSNRSIVSQKNLYKFLTFEFSRKISNFLKNFRQFLRMLEIYGNNCFFTKKNYEDWWEEWN